MSSNFYRTFEDRFRGSRDSIKERLKVYIPFVLAVSKNYNPAYAVDLGCGRGEWLELLAENGFLASGVDTDHGMLAACKERGLNVSTDDAVTFLKDLTTDSQSVISAFHLVEHIPFESVLDLAKESLRALKPGGLLILETPNPENIIVGSCNFYIDPTHKRPIPPQLLAFVPEYLGFSRVKVLRLQEPRKLIENDHLSLLDVLSGVSPDYAVVAQKGGAPELVNAADPAFRAEFGITLETLAHRWQQQIEERLRMAEAQATLVNEHARHAETGASAVKQPIAEGTNSRRWQITEPMRAMTKHAEWLARGSIAWLTFSPGSRPRRIMRMGLIFAMDGIRSRPRLKNMALKGLSQVPWLQQWLRRIAYTQSGNDIKQYSTASVETYDVRPAYVSSSARQIYTELKSAIEKHNMDNG